MDLYSRKIIGWAYDINMSADLAIKAVKNACANVSNPEGIVLQSDLGTQYTSDIFEKFLAGKKYVIHTVVKDVHMIMPV